MSKTKEHSYGRMQALPSFPASPALTLLPSLTLNLSTESSTSGLQIESKVLVVRDLRTSDALCQGNGSPWAVQQPGGQGCSWRCPAAHTTKWGEQLFASRHQLPHGTGWWWGGLLPKPLQGSMVNRYLNPKASSERRRGPWDLSAS